LRLARASYKNQRSDSGEHRKRFVSHFIFHRIALFQRVKGRVSRGKLSAPDTRPSTFNPQPSSLNPPQQPSF
jgi:hypothetical protein